MVTIEVPEGLDPTDLAALRLAMDRQRASSEFRARQLDEMLLDRSWEEVAQFAAFSQQVVNLRLRPFQVPPCHVRDENEPRRGEETGAKLLKRMLAAGISEWHPDPMRALEEAEA